VPVLPHHSVPEKESVTPEMPDFGNAAECFAEQIQHYSSNQQRKNHHSYQKEATHKIKQF
tara:strand:+ start:235 stop:414 length:180 start_codon:yes stop_codon:yes gene_type:complete